MAELKILYEDGDIIAAVKPAGVDSEAARGLAPDMVNLVRSHLAAGKGAPYVGVIQRLDRPVSGIMVFAKNPETAAALSKALREGKFQKLYRAILCGVPEKAEDTLTDWLVQEKKGNLTRTGRKGEPGAKEARLMYRILRSEERDGQWYSEAEIRLLTGRHHQIRSLPGGCPFWATGSTGCRMRATGNTDCRPRETGFVYVQSGLRFRIRRPGKTCLFPSIRPFRFKLKKPCA